MTKDKALPSVKDLSIFLSDILLSILCTLFYLCFGTNLQGTYYSASLFPCFTKSNTINIKIWGK